MSIKDEYSWWQTGIIYQIYPRSFMDSNGDGIGDLPGIVSKLDYLLWLGVDAIWLSPIYPSPMADFGYDISDHSNIDPIFGKLGDFDSLLKAAHDRSIKVILDFVPNHTSEEHPWFLESRSSRHNSKRNWYIWRDPSPDGRTPNNWLSCFGGSAWEWDPATRQYYYHAYLKQQPDLNWRNPEVQAAMFDILRFWLDRGVDGFRVDALRHIIKDEQFRDNPPDPRYRPGLSPFRELIPINSTDRPEVHGIVAGMRRVLDEYGGRVMIGELYLPVERLVTYYGAGGTGIHLPSNFQLIELPWNADRIASAIGRYESLLPSYGWPNWVLGNHDNSRIANRIGAAQARVAAILLLTLRGTPTMYYGDEIGMHDVEIPPELVQDPLEKNVPGLGLGRDPERTPMQWDGSLNAGFTAGTPWLPVAADDYAALNVAAEREDAFSVLTLYRQLITLRRAEPALLVGEYIPVATSDDVIAYMRKKGDECFFIVLNLSSKPKTLNLPGPVTHARLLLSTHLDRYEDKFSGRIRIRGDEGLVIKQYYKGTCATDL